MNVQLNAEERGRDSLGRHGARVRARRPWHLLLASIALLAVAGCAAPQRGPEVTETGDVIAPSYAELAAAHNTRVAQLSNIHSRGVIEIVWRDEDGVRRFRQGDAELWLSLPHRTALRVGKLAETYMWLGSDSERYWLFDLVEERVLYTGRHDSTAEAPELHTVHPLALLDLIGLGPVVEFHEAESPEVEYDRRRDAWVVRTWGSGGPVRMYFDRATRLPQRIETYTRAGEVAYVSTIDMQRYRSVPVPGISAAAQPRLATRVDMVTAGDAAAGIAEGEVKLVLDSPTGRVDGQPLDRVFDLERLMRSLRPQRIEGDLPEAQPQTAQR